MSINKFNSDITDIFKTFYEPGSEDLSQGTSVAKTTVPTTNKSLFRGELKFENDGLYLYSIGGGKFEIEVKGEKPVQNVSSKTVTVDGIQQGGKIVEASIHLQTHKAASPSKTREINTEINKVAQAAKSFAVKYSGIRGLIGVRPGYKYYNGQISKTPAIVAIVERKINKASILNNELLPSDFDNIDVEVISADPRDLLLYKYSKVKAGMHSLIQKIGLTYLESLMAGSVVSSSEDRSESFTQEINYIPPSNVNLDEVNEAMTLTCNVSPEGGWKSLSPFLLDASDGFQVAMYDFSAPHIVETLKDVLRSGVSIKMVYDGNSASGVGRGSKIDDVTEESSINSFKRIGGRNFEAVKAWKGKDGICNNAYHIKVAVKDKTSFWLSSGNWQTSNQPSDDFESNPGSIGKYNREWNVIVKSKTLSDVFQKFIEWDFDRSSEKPEAMLFEDLALPDLYDEEELLETGRFQLFPPKKFVFTRNNPLRVQPVLSPDNYIEQALQVIRSATQTLYFINQYITFTDKITDEYTELLDELLEKCNSVTIDCKIILRSQSTSKDRAMLDSLQAYGFNMARIRLMKNTHTKGIIADGSTILIGSHNWSGAGVQFNRDASLVVFNADVAQYYQDVFLHDWERRTKRPQREEVWFTTEEIEQSPTTRSFLKRVEWSEYLS